eukprot:1179286-Prorocentrum_minimum.AAC.1
MAQSPSAAEDPRSDTIRHIRPDSPRGDFAEQGLDSRERLAELLEWCNQPFVAPVTHVMMANSRGTRGRMSPLLVLDSFPTLW